MATGGIRKSMVLPLNCPYCDEVAYPKDHSQRVVTDHDIYTLRRCIMGHEFYSKESVPEDQDKVTKYIQSLKKKKWNAYMQKYRSSEEYLLKAEQKRKQWQLYREAEKRAQKTAKEIEQEERHRKAMQKFDADRIHSDIQSYDEES